MTTTPTRRRVALPGISSLAWEHPADKGALVALRRLRGFDTVVKRISGPADERALRLLHLGAAVRVDERQFAHVHRLRLDVCATLDLAEPPELYVLAEPAYGAVTIGMQRPFIVLTSGLVELLDAEELRVVVGHEVGHVLSGHAVYQTLLHRLLALGAAAGAVPLGGLTVRAIIAALQEWSRKAELSADRAGLLAAQDPAAALRVHMKLAGGGQLEHLDTTSFLAQGAEYLAAGALRDSVLKLLLVEQDSHPFPVLRAAELRAWTDSGAYARILDGDYPRRTDEDAARVSEAAQEAARSYAGAFRSAQDAVAQALRDLGDGVGSVRDWLGSTLRASNR